MSTSEPARDPGALSSSDPRLRAWRAFLEAHARLSRRLDDELRSEHGLSLAEYDALLQLAEAPGRRLRMNQLADRVILSRSGVTRLIDRLVADGYVGRAHCPSDARGAEAVLTDAGFERLRAAARTHLRGIDRHFLSVVAPDDLGVVGRALGDVARRACPGGVPPGGVAPGGEGARSPFELDGSSVETAGGRRGSTTGSA
ncbi:MAG TPA: MarR family winged helix-turn-helix transcriptional regulator [Candidatus Dormibacteraeota bacterium]|nr:MarR family winged helix-turn-helix transcriptional regulator [Candidatus Dormibacteraeota bacterium]